MLQAICHHTSNAILTALKQEILVEDGAICQPSAYFASIHRMQSTVLGIVAEHNLNGPDSLALNDVFQSLKGSLAGENTFTASFNLLSKAEKQALTTFLDWFKSQHLARVELSDLYESMLLLEFPVRDGVIMDDKEHLNSIGSFYTPTLLADTLVQLTIDNYILKNLGIEQFSKLQSSEADLERVTELLRNSSYADHSCGTGSFFLALIRYFKKHLCLSHEDLKKMVLNFHAIEADSISLEIARICVLEAVDGLALYPELSKRFVNGNPLIWPDDEADAFDHSPNFYYHNGLALRPDQIQRCDVIIGNPPWGSIGFDLSHYLHLLCPRLAEIDDEEELDTALEILEESHPELYRWLLMHDEAVDVAMENVYNDERFDHSCMGGLQTNVLFTELCDSLGTERSSVGLILKGSTLSDPVNKRLWHHLLHRKRVVARYDLINCNKIFNIDRTEEFSVLILGKNQDQPILHQTELTHLSEIAAC
ncbi:MAG: hypothetical protein K9J17_13775 [Flavobacteriales bacterium]|nr:hypothetical protein [Flavobacteriales bacterium]